MPPNVTIAAFVLGAVLLLVAILHGGGFKIFGAEVDGTAGRFGRIFAGLLGVVLIGIGLFSSPYKPAPQPAAGPQKTSDDSASGAAQKPTGPVQADQTVNIAGTWHDGEGNEFQISQHGDAFTIRITGITYEASSSGVLHGHDFERTYEGQMIKAEGQMAKGTRFSGHCNGAVSNDAKVMRADCFDEKGSRGPWESVLMR
ncbi:MAG: hypothetical protein WBS19_06990 [Candidatus Korobacteraceae bacterium]